MFLRADSDGLPGPPDIVYVVLSCVMLSVDCVVSGDKTREHVEAGKTETQIVLCVSCCMSPDTDLVTKQVLQEEHRSREPRNVPETRSFRSLAIARWRYL